MPPGDVELVAQREQLGVERFNLRAEVGGLLPGRGRPREVLQRLLPARALRLLERLVGLPVRVVALLAELRLLALDLPDLAFEARDRLVGLGQRRDGPALVRLPRLAAFAPLGRPPLLAQRLLDLRGPRRRRLTVPGDGGVVRLDQRRQLVDLANESRRLDLATVDVTDTLARGLHLGLREMHQRVRLGGV